ncbi:WYL domain-containing protein, partial [candidate division TA06 bacterium]
KIKKHKDGSLSLSFPAPALYEVKRWILQWGQEAEALEPKELRQSIAEDVQKLAKRYKKRVK